MNRKLRRSLRVGALGLGFAAAAAPASQAQTNEFIPGYTDFPNALRIESSESFTPGHSDFPNHLRVESIYDRARANGGVEERLVIVPSNDAGPFDWADAGIGAGGALGLILLAGGAALAVTRRPVRRTALQG